MKTEKKKEIVFIVAIEICNVCNVGVTCHRMLFEILEL